MTTAPTQAHARFIWDACKLGEKEPSHLVDQRMKDWKKRHSTKMDGKPYIIFEHNATRYVFQEPAFLKWFASCCSTQA